VSVPYLGTTQAGPPIGQPTLTVLPDASFFVLHRQRVKSHLPLGQLIDPSVNLWGVHSFGETRTELVRNLSGDAEVMGVKAVVLLRVWCLGFSSQTPFD